MKLSTAIKKLKAAGYKITENCGSFAAAKDSVSITFHANNGVTSKFTYDSLSSCAPTFGMTLKAAMA
jgi:hypothetical protein